MSIKTLQEIIESGFDGWRRDRMEFCSPSDLPNHTWSNDWHGEQFERFSEGEVFEEIPLRTWMCTDTIVGLYAILWHDELIAFTYQPFRKSERNWFFVIENGEKLMWESFVSYAPPPKAEHRRPVIADDDSFYRMIFDPAARFDWQTGPVALMEDAP
jgi:hypothetical protein